MRHTTFVLLSENTQSNIMTIKTGDSINTHPNLLGSAGPHFLL